VLWWGSKAPHIWPITLTGPVFRDFVPFFGIYWKIVLEKLQILGILAKLSQKCSKLDFFVEFYNFLLLNVPNFLPFFPKNFPNFTIFGGVFVKFYYFPPQKKVPNFTLFPKKVPNFTIFVDPEFPKPSKWEVWYGQYSEEQQRTASEEDVLKSIKALAVSHESALSHCLRLSETLQSPQQNIHGYLAILRGLAQPYKFEVGCTAQGWLLVNNLRTVRPNWTVLWTVLQLLLLNPNFDFWTIFSFCPLEKPSKNSFRDILENKIL